MLCHLPTSCFLVHAEKVSPSRTITTPPWLIDGLLISDYIKRSTARIHCARRTKASLIYAKTKNLRAIQLLLGHAKLESTIEYLGVEIEDALRISESCET